MTLTERLKELRLGEHQCRANMAGLFLENHNLLDDDFFAVRPKTNFNLVVSRNDIVRDKCELVVFELG